MEELKTDTELKMKLDQNDLINIMVEDQKEELEGIVDECDERLEKISKESHKHKVKLVEILQSHGKESGEYQYFHEAAKTLRLKVYTDRIQARTGNKALEKSYDHVHIDDLNRGSEPLRRIRSATRTKYLHHTTVGDIEYYLEASNKEGGYMHYKTTVLAKNIKLKETGPILKKINDLEDEAFALEQRKNAADVAILQITYGDKRIKAKLTRAALSKSKDGQNILGVINSITEKGLTGKKQLALK